MIRRSAKPIQLPTDPQSIGYLAGLIDGEGCIRITRAFSKNKSRNWSHFAAVIVVNTSAVLMDWLASLGGSVKAHNRNRPAHWKPCWSWNIHGENAVRLLTAIRPYMRIKGQQADIALALHHLKQKTRLGRPKGSALTEAEVSASEALRQEMLTLNDDRHVKRFKIVN